MPNAGPYYSEAKFTVMRPFCFQTVTNMSHQIRKHTNNTRGELNYISTVIYILIVALTLAVIIDVLSIVLTKQKLDAVADQVTRQIQLAGKVDTDTEQLLETLTADLGKATAITYAIDTDYITKEGCTTAIQLGTPFYLTITADVQLGGFWQLVGIPMQLTSTAAGVSERYWK